MLYDNSNQSNEYLYDLSTLLCYRFHSVVFLSSLLLKCKKKKLGQSSRTYIQSMLVHRLLRDRLHINLA